MSAGERRHAGSWRRILMLSDRTAPSMRRPRPSRNMPANNKTLVTAGVGSARLEIGGAETGEAKITRGYQLRARHVIHAVGPVWNGGKADEEELLASCYRGALALAAGNKPRSI